MVMNSKTTASKAAKEAGFTNLKQVQEIGGESQQTLGNWFKSEKHPERFDIHLLGCAVKIGLITTTEKD
jgi:alkyl hydroperoxide reductase subunit AhpF